MVLVGIVYCGIVGSFLVSIGVMTVVVVWRDYCSSCSCGYFQWWEGVWSLHTLHTNLFDLLEDLIILLHWLLVVFCVSLFRIQVMFVILLHDHRVLLSRFQLAYFIWYWMFHPFPLWVKEQQFYNNESLTLISDYSAFHSALNRLIFCILWDDKYSVNTRMHICALRWILERSRSSQAPVCFAIAYGHILLQSGATRVRKHGHVLLTLAFAVPFTFCFHHCWRWCDAAAKRR